VTTDYELGTPCKIAVSIFDEVRKGENKEMGSAVFDVAELLGSNGNIKAKRLQKGGTLFASVRRSVGAGMLRLQLRGKKLKNVDGLFGKSDPFFELSRRVDSDGRLTWDNVYRSKVIENNLNPEWDAAVIELSTLCSGDLDKPIQLDVYDHEKNGKHVSMGRCETTVKGFVRAAATGESFKLTRNGKDFGSISVVRAEVSGIVDDLSQKMANVSVVTGAAALPPPIAPPATALPVGVAPPASFFAPAVSAVAGSAPYVPGIAATAPSVDAGIGANFIDYLSGGCELNVVVAIDFTGSNGDPRKPGTLHHFEAAGRNDYEKAISAIVSILAKYDSDQRFPVLGFGAKYGGIVRHCFQCGPTEDTHGVQGVLDAYHQVFQSGLIMSGPTVFTEVIETAAARASSSLDAAQRRGRQSYTVLLILTDGAVSDAQATAACLNRVGTSSPLSVVIVGVGNADFGAMQFLDDAVVGPGKRDIAQFVEFNKHSHSSVSLTSETLREIPNQLTGYFQSRGVPPLPAVQHSDSAVFVDPEEEEIDLSLDIGEEEIVVTGGGIDFVDGFVATR